MVKPGLTKPKCLAALLDARPLRQYGLSRAAEFVEKFPWRGFLWQAPQALYSLTGYGVILGTGMGALTDLFWGAVRAPFSGLPRVQLPVADDPIMKAARYISQAPYHLFHGQVLSYEDHWLLALADAAAITILSGAFPAAILNDRIGDFAASPEIQFRPWNAATLQVLGELGIDPDAEQVPVIPGMTAQSSYAEILSAIARNFPNWLQTVQREFPATVSASAFAKTLSDAGRDFFRWSLDGVEGLQPIFEPEELAFARLFEYGIFPDHDLAPEEIDVFLQRALEISFAGGRDLPARSDLIAAANEVWGGWVPA